MSCYRMGVALLAAMPAMDARLNRDHVERALRTRAWQAAEWHSE